MSGRGLAVITGASRGIGFELARCAAAEGYDLLICADDPAIARAVQDLRADGARVQGVQADLSRLHGVDELLSAIGRRPVEVLMANAGIGLGGRFLDQDILRALDVVNTNVMGMLVLVQAVGRRMVRAGRGRILITGSIAGFLPGSHAAVYNGTKAFVDSFSMALRDELSDSGVTVTCLMPGPTGTDFFDRAGMADTAVGRGPKQDAGEVAAAGFRAMMRGDSRVVPGFMNKLQAAVSGLVPDGILARMHRHIAKHQPRR